MQVGGPAAAEESRGDGVVVGGLNRGIFGEWFAKTRQGRARFGKSGGFNDSLSN